MRSDSRDEVFREPKGQVTDFAFDRSVAAVFDDMVTRSVPLYVEIQRMVRELAADFAVAHTCVYDLGCSTGTTLLLLDDTVDTSIRFIGVDAGEVPRKIRRARSEAGP